MRIFTFWLFLTRINLTLSYLKLKFVFAKFFNDLLNIPSKNTSLKMATLDGRNM